jgi:hypothetical protein
MPLYVCLSECIDKNIELVLSNEILIAFESSYPWAETHDPLWAGHLRDWYQLISPSIQRADIIEVVAGPTIANCSLVGPTTAAMFSRFLSVFGSSTMHGGVHEEAIFISNQCLYPVQFGKFYHVINPKNELVKVIYPWLRLYNRDLPYEGDYPFIPPSNWKNSPNPIKGTLRGYLDNAGSSWEWDRMHDNHWDVQHSNKKGDYTNVSPDGRVLTN